MLRVEPKRRIDADTEHRINQWMMGEVCRFYVEQRQRFCDSLHLLDLHFFAPLCQDCACLHPFPLTRPPDISHRGWKDDIAWTVGEDVITTVRKERRKDPEFGFSCKRCLSILRPWEGDDLYVVSYHIEDHFHFPLVRPGQIEPPREVRRQLMNLYGNRCFSCGSERPLHIDHINPRDNGGEGIFRNLQPLCERCGQAKGNRIPEEVTVLNTMYFGPYPSDAYEGLFW